MGLYQQRLSMVVIYVKKERIPMELIDCRIATLADIEELRSRLGQIFPSVEESSEQTTVDVYDSFDWRLHQKGWQLFKNNNTYSLFHAASGRSIGEIEVTDKKPRRFSWDFAPSDLADTLAPVLEMRAILPMATIERKTEVLALCNEDAKTVVRLSVEALTAKDGDQTIIHCHLLPVRGYEEEAREVISVFDELKFSALEVLPVVSLLRKQGIEPGAYSSKIKVKLSPKMPAAQAVQCIMQNTASVMHQNLDGVIQDIDSEFLHDLRVAVRRSRSLLGVTKGVLDPGTTAALQTLLKAMGAATGEVRDLDVYLLKKQAYVEYVPEVLKPGILQFFQVLQRKRKTALNKMLKAMKGDAFEEALAALDDFVVSDVLQKAGAQGSTPVLELAKGSISKRFNKIIKKGGRIVESTPDEEIHNLRIECKKLRYLLEFFISLFPAAEMKTLIGQLKKLQENLGDFNDLSVQQDFLAGYLETITPKTPRMIMLSAATGGLITRLAMDQGRVRSDFFSAFQAFASAENKLRFKALFS